MHVLATTLHEQHSMFLAADGAQQSRLSCKAAVQALDLTPVKQRYRDAYFGLKLWRAYTDGQPWALQDLDGLPQRNDGLHDHYAQVQNSVALQRSVRGSLCLPSECICFYSVEDSCREVECRPPSNLVYQL